jgi:predicted phage baseplate assembly protein
MLLVDLWAYMGDILHYYVDRAASEAFIETATQRESVVAFANLFDYIPSTRESATATVTVINNGTTDETLPENTEFVAVYDGNYYYFYSTAEATVVASTTQVVPVVEGELVEEEILTNASSGGVNQRYVLRELDVVPSSVRVFVYEDAEEPGEWQRVDNLAGLDFGVEAFAVYVNANGETEVIFGSYLNGRIPPAGVKITATYRVSQGESGNIPANYITLFRNLTSSNLAIQSSTAATGGVNPESVDSIKNAIQTISKAQNRAVTLSDFADLTLRIQSVRKSAAAYNAGTNTVTVYPVPYVSDYVNYTGYSIAVPTSLQDRVEAYLQPLAMVGVTVASATSIVVHRVDITMTVKVNDTFVAPWVQDAVTRSVESLFTFDAITLGREIRVADVYRAVLSVPGVEYATVSSLLMKNSSNATVSTLGATELLRKGTITMTVTGGVSTS